MRRTPTAIPGLTHLDGPVFSDERGSFTVGWRAADLDGLEGWQPFVQESISTSGHNVLRGLHLQHPRAQGKLVRVLAGAVHDVAVDLRAGSATHGEWVAGRLAHDGRALWIPPGFAHGFLVTEAPAVMVYQVTDAWVPGDEIAIRWDDATLGIDWPLAAPPVLSARDAAAPPLSAVLPRLGQ